MKKLWVRIGIAIGFLTLVGVIALVADQLFTIPKYVVAAGVLVAGGFSIVAVRRSLAPLAEVARVVDGIADGNLDQRRVPDERHDEVGQLATSVNRMLGQLNGLSRRAKRLADGKIEVGEVEQRVRRTQDLSDADLAVSKGDGDLETSFIAMTNQLRRLTIQARMISEDQFFSPLLDQRVPGELGAAFGAVVDGLRNITSHARIIAEGDLSSRVDGEGDITDAFNQMIDNLQRLVEKITHTSIRISTAAEQILAVLREQEMAANHQASSVEETQRTMETLLSSAKKISDNAQHVFKSAEKTQQKNRKIAERIGELKSHTERISEILANIKRIADRSDLLALNASLEGMRAGEAGKGFTLVAAEMRRLAENIKGSVGDIKELVEDIGESSMASAMATDEGTRLSENTTDNALKITLITQQQKSGTEQVTQSMDDLSELINQDVAGTKQVTTAASELTDLADSLRELVDTFSIAGRQSISAEYEAVKRQQPSLSARQRTPVGRADSAQGVSATSSLVEQSSELEASRPTAVAADISGAMDVSSAREGPSTPADDSTTADNSNKIPIDSGADQPTIEFSTSMPDDQQREAMHEMLAGDDDSKDLSPVADPAAADADPADPDTDPVGFGEEPDEESSASVDAQIDALERELEKSSDPQESVTEDDSKP